MLIFTLMLHIACSSISNCLFLCQTIYGFCLLLIFCLRNLHVSSLKMSPFVLLYSIEQMLKDNIVYKKKSNH